MSERTAIETLAETYPQLYRNPDREEKDAYRKVVLQGETCPTSVWIRRTGWRRWRRPRDRSWWFRSGIGRIMRFLSAA